MTTNDLGAISARATDAARNRAMYGPESRSRRITNDVSAADVPGLVDEVQELRDLLEAISQTGSVGIDDWWVRIRGLLREYRAGHPSPTLLAGATDVGEPGTWPANAGEFAARWNRHPPEDRDRHVRGIVEAQQIVESIDRAATSVLTREDLAVSTARVYRGLAMESEGVVQHLIDWALANVDVPNDYGSAARAVVDIIQHGPNVAKHGGAYPAADASYDDLIAASAIDNATRVDDATDDAGHEHREVTS
jgi:hypothetical protein